MSRPIDTWPEASADIKAAVDWYDERRPGLGNEFLKEVDRMLGLIAIYPESCQKFRKSLRRALLHRFDYAVVYRTRADAIEVVAVMNCRRRPASILRRVSTAAD